MKYKLITFIVAASTRSRRGEILESKDTRSAPKYFDVSVPQRAKIGEEKRTVGGQDVVYTINAYPTNEIVVEAHVDIDDIYAETTLPLKEALLDEAYEVAKKKGGKTHLSEEYSIVVVSDYQKPPEEIYNREAMTTFLKSEKYALDEKEIERTLASQIKYSKDDLVIVDWDGAFIFEPVGEEGSLVELLRIANLQLLRYRILDSELDERIKKISKFIQTAPTTIFKRKEIENALRAVVDARAKSLADFEALDRDIKLIGDWYSARLYDLASRKFKLEEWRTSVKDKLDTVEDIYTIVAENFSTIRMQFLEMLQIVGFFILQIGWFVLIILEFTDILK